MTKLKTEINHLDLCTQLHQMVVPALLCPIGEDDLMLGYNFHETAQGVRFTVSEAARREVLSQLLKLNHERWEEEQKVKDEGGKMKGRSRR